MVYRSHFLRSNFSFWERVKSLSIANSKHTHTPKLARTPRKTCRHQGQLIKKRFSCWRFYSYLLVLCLFPFLFPTISCFQCIAWRMHSWDTWRQRHQQWRCYYFVLAHPKLTYSVFDLPNGIPISSHLMAAVMQRKGRPIDVSATKEILPCEWKSYGSMQHILVDVCVCGWHCKYRIHSIALAVLLSEVCIVLYIWINRL